MDDLMVSENSDLDRAKELKDGFLKGVEASVKFTGLKEITFSP
jgi:hypothetical protein